MAASAPSGMYVNMNSGAVQAGLMPFRNALINGDMRINQRGTSTNLASLTGVATTTPGSWVADRWNVYRSGFIAGAVIGQGTSLTLDDLPFSEAGIKTFARVGRLSGNTNTTTINFNYNMESQDCYKYIGKEVTLSFYYRTGTNFSGVVVSDFIATGTGNDQSLRSTYTGLSYNGTSAQSPSSTWRRISFTRTLPTTLTQISVGFDYAPVGTAGPNDYFDITGIQLELGSVPTSFEVRPYPVELQMCMRYYQILVSTAIRRYMSNIERIPMSFRVNMRTAPVSTTTTGGSVVNVAFISFTVSNSFSGVILIGITGSGLGVIDIDVVDITLNSEI